MITAADMAAHLATRRTIREFRSAPVARAAIDRVLAAAQSAPSATNRQPWRFTVVTHAATRARIVDAVREATLAIDRVIRTGPHAEEWGRYGDFFWQPLASAPVVIVPAVREHPDTVGGYLRSAGADPARFALPSAMAPERCALGCAVMALMCAAHADGLGAAWLAGPMVARAAVEAACGIAPPWQMAGAVALGHPAVVPPAPPRRAAAHVVTWIEEDPP